MRRIILVSLLLAPAAYAEPLEGGHFVLGGFLGADYFGNNVHFDSARNADLDLGTSPVVGVRLGYQIFPAGGEHALPLSFGVEGELAMTPTSTQTSMASTSSSSYFAPYLGYRAHAIARFGDDQLGVHVLAGAGALQVATAAPFVKDDLEGMLYVGAGIDVSLGRVGSLRFDMRNGWMNALDDGGRTPVYEAQLGINHAFGARSAPHHAEVAHATPSPLPAPLPPPAPPQPEPVKDRDGDGIADALDRCPDEPEDKDGFEDSDGCPDADNDHDGVADKSDVCPTDPETANGFQDEDGCPDEIPAAVRDALVGASTVTFEPKKPKLTKASAPALTALAEVLKAHTSLRIVITTHPESATDAELAQRRAEAVRFFLEDRGIPLVRAEVEVGPPANKQTPLVRVRLFVPTKKPKS